MKEIREAAFYATAIEILTVPEGVAKVGPYAFKKCTSLVTLPSTWVSIGDSAFYSCTALTSITIPAKVIKVGEYCFSKDTALKNVTFKGNAPGIGTGAFNGVTAKACYPKGNSSWTSEKSQNYGGSISWTAQ